MNTHPKHWRINPHRAKTHPPIFEQLENMKLRCQGHRRCTKTPTYIVAIHAINNCAHRNQLTTNGDTIFLLCHACTNAAAWRIGEIIGHMYENIPDHNHDDTELACTTCGRRILEIHDILHTEGLNNGRMQRM